MNRIFQILLLCLFLPVLTGCETLGKIAEVIADPDIQVGEDEEQPSQIMIHAYAAADVNLNFDGEPSPLIIKIFALSSDHRLFSFDFFAVTEETEETLGVTLRENLDEVMVEPDTYKVFGPYEIPKGTKKLAVVAEYLDIESSIWRASVDVKPVGSDEPLLLLLLEEEARLTKEQ